MISSENNKMDMIKRILNSIPPLDLKNIEDRKKVRQEEDRERTTEKKKRREKRYREVGGGVYMGTPKKIHLTPAPPTQLIWLNPVSRQSAGPPAPPKTRPGAVKRYGKSLAH